MDIKVRFFATFREGRGKELLLQCPQDASVRQVLADLAIEPETVAILLVNGRDYDLDAALKPGDTVSLFPPVGGG